MKVYIRDKDTFKLKHHATALEYDMTLDFLIKSSTLSGEKNLAVPLVGKT